MSSESMIYNESQARQSINQDIDRINREIELFEQIASLKSEQLRMRNEMNASSDIYSTTCRRLDSKVAEVDVQARELLTQVKELQGLKLIPGAGEQAPAARPPAMAASAAALPTPPKGVTKSAATKPAKGKGVSSKAKAVAVESGRTLKDVIIDVISDHSEGLTVLEVAKTISDPESKYTYETTAKNFPDNVKAAVRILELKGLIEKSHVEGKTGVRLFLASQKKSSRKS